MLWREENYMNLAKLPWRKSVAFLGMGFWVSSLALISQTAQSSGHNVTPYCFNIQIETEMYAHPSYHSEVIGRYAVGDVAYATTNPIKSYWFRDRTKDGNSFIKVAGFDGTVGWVPRFPKGSDAPILVDLADCPDPGVNASGFPGGSGDDRVCYFVLSPTNLYGRPDFHTPLDANYAETDIAYASYPFHKVVVDHGRNAFVLVDIYEDNQAWVPFFSENLDTKLVEQYPPEDCERPM
jgi:hypothetical protein